MFDRFDDRTLEIATVIVVVVIALVILCYLAIYINPWVFFNPFKPATPTMEVAMALPTVPTWTPSPTPTATNTPLPTSTWTPTPRPTNTPTPTDTNTPTPTPTNTPLPPTATRKPKPPAPTPTPTPWPYYPKEGVGWVKPNCSWTGIWGYVVGANGLAEANVQVRVGNDQNWKDDTWTNAEGIYGYIFANEPKAGRWFVRVFKGGQPRSMHFWWDTSAGCEGEYSINQIRIDWLHR